MGFYFIEKESREVTSEFEKGKRVLGRTRRMNMELEPKDTKRYNDKNKRSRKIYKLPAPQEQDEAMVVSFERILDVSFSRRRPAEGLTDVLSWKKMIRSKRACSKKACGLSSRGADVLSRRCEGKRESVEEISERVKAEKRGKIE